MEQQHLGYAWQLNFLFDEKPIESNFKGACEVKFLISVMLEVGDIMKAWNCFGVCCATGLDFRKLLKQLNRT